MKKYLFLLLVLVLIFNSCSDFLTEDNTFKKSDGVVYSTQTAIEQLVATCYSYNRLWYGKEAAFTMSDGGTDIWYNGKDNTASLAFATYQGLTSDNYNIPFNEYWEGFYAAINLCNTAEDLTLNNSNISEANKAKYLSQVRFLRAFYYWHLVETWGPVPLHLTPITQPTTSAVRNSVDEIYEQMFKDVQYAIDNLPSSEAASSKVTHWAAKAFMARLSLYYASTEYGHTEYYEKAATLAKDVITNSGKGLYDNYADVWNQNNEAAANNKEFIWAIDYYNTINASTPYNNLPLRTKLDGNGNPVAWSGMILRQPQEKGGGGNVQHLWVTPVWNTQTTATGGASLSDVLPRWVGINNLYTKESPTTKVPVDIGRFYVKYGMGYARYAPTRYLLDLFDETRDQRWEASFRQVWYKHPLVAPKGWGTATCTYPKMSMGADPVLGDTVMYYLKHIATTEQRTWASGRYKIMDLANCFQGDGMTPTTTVTDGGSTMFISLKKFEDYQSQIALVAAASFNNYFSNRDFPVFRMSEMYLIVAEAELSSNPTEALKYINDLRSKRALPGKSAELQLSSVDLDKIMDERALEFCGENIRWFDLKRTRKMEVYVPARNKVAFWDNHFYLRPIPATEMALIENVSTTVGTGFWQNPGY
jgi:starch-binding outer membrane protein, SusD/RagB family